MFALHAELDERVPEPSLPEPELLAPSLVGSISPIGRQRRLGAHLWIALIAVLGCSRPEEAPPPRAAASGSGPPPASAEPASRSEPAASGEASLRAKYPPRWTSHLALEDVTHIEAALDEPLKPNDQELTLGRARKADGEREELMITTCRQYGRARAGGYTAATTFDISQESFFRKRCAPLAFLQQARPSSASFVSELRLDADPLALLPAAMSFDVAPPSKEQQMLLARGVSLKAYEPTLVVKSQGATSVVLNDPVGQFEGSVDLVAWGDHDHDGVEDVLFFQTAHALEGSYRAYWHVIATRKGPGEPLVVSSAAL